MCSLARRAASPPCLVALFILPIALAGCAPQKSESEAIDRFFKDNPKAKRETVAKFAGHVTVDGQPPEKGSTRLFILLNDPQHLQKLPTRFMQVADDGSFEFMTYLAGDGVPVGKYVVEFVQLHPPRGGRQRQGGGIGRTFVGPDVLKNLYNDPERNQQQDEKTFVVNVEAPGRTDYDFNLAVAGKDPVIAPGKYAATTVPGQ
ncbi:MAG TPA: hypothetical protein VFG04_05735 [Planctomycetaceae bacterium]|jgi:hypothetical protein|nr:hypothetical protein [Planctomycetaceae bacterium]